MKMERLSVPKRFKGLKFPRYEHSPGALEEGIAPLVQVLHTVGLKTMASCEGGYRLQTYSYPYVGFFPNDDIESQIKKAIAERNFQWQIHNIHEFIHELQAEMPVRSHKEVIDAQINSIHLAKYLMEYFEINNRKAIQLFNEFEVELKGRY